MATTKTWAIKCTLNKAIKYITDESKTDGKLLVSSYGCSPETADIEFAFTREQAVMDKGDNIGRHLVQNFAPGEVTPEEAHQIGMELAQELLKGQYEFVLTTHIDKGHIHNHIIFNSVSFSTHRKYNSNKRTYRMTRSISDRICKAHGLSVVIPDKDSGKGKSYKEYVETKNGSSYKARLKAEMDRCINLAADYEEFLEMMRLAGYEIKYGKQMSFRAAGQGQERFTRGKTIGAAYTEERIKQRIQNRKKAPTLQSRLVAFIEVADNPKMIENPGYKQWATLHNLKLAARTLSYLSEHDILDYEQLQSKIENVNNLYDSAGSDIKQLERHMEKLSLLIRNVENYRRTKPYYEQYQKTKYKDKYRQYNEDKLIIFQAAKKSLGGHTLQDLTQLKEEYQCLASEKKELYKQYRKCREQKKEIETIKANLDQILYESPVKEKRIEKNKGR